MCEYSSLYFGDDGYVVRCKECDHYQVAFICIVITLTQEDFGAFCRIVKRKYEEADDACPDNCKCIILKTPAEGICFLLTKNEIKRFAEILEEADSEAKALRLISMINKGE